MADRSVVASNTFEQFRVEFNELATDVGDIASITGASGTIASATDVIEAVVQINNALDAADLDGAGDSGTFAVDLDTQSLTIAGTSNEIETVASGQTLTIGLPNAVTISGTMTAGNISTGGNVVATGNLQTGGNLTNGSINLTFPTVGGTVSTEGFSIALATALG
tara:strand:- start:998 stop:1492 length:495 start_codon:yes stop_codon:yes gene_type:complete